MSCVNLLEDYRGKPVAREFYDYELHRIANPLLIFVSSWKGKKEDKIYVKWFGFNNSYNSWIHKDNVL